MGLGDCAFHRSPVPPRVMVSMGFGVVPVASFVMASGVIAMVNADFLARCDVLSHRPVTTFLGSIISVVALSVISIKRLRH